MFSLQSLAVFIPMLVPSFLTYMVRQDYHVRHLVFSPPTIPLNPHTWEKNLFNKSSTSGLTFQQMALHHERAS